MSSAKRQSEQHGHEGQVGDDDAAFRARPGRTQHESLRDRTRPDRTALLEARVDEEQRGQSGQLKERQRGRHLQVEELRGLPVDLDLEGRVLRPAKDEDHTERREGEQKDDRRRGRNGGPQKRQRHANKCLPSGGAEDACAVLESRIELRPHAADDAQHDGVVVEDVRDQDRPDRVLQPQAEGAARAKQRNERGRNHDRGQHERDERDGVQHPAPREIEPRKHVRRRGARQGRSARSRRQPARP